MLFRPLAQADILGQFDGGPRQVGDPRVTLADETRQRIAVWGQQAGDVGIEGGVGEVILQLRGGYRDLGIEQCRVQNRDTVAEAGRPPPP